MGHYFVLLKQSIYSHTLCYVQRNEGKGEDLNAGTFNEIKINTN